VFYNILYQTLSDELSWLNIFKYQTFRCICAFLLSFIFVLSLEPVFIKWLKNKGVAGQPIRDDGPKDHEVKRGTPTMGGAVMIVAIGISSFLFCDLLNPYVWITLLVTLSFAYLGFLDDWTKVTKQNSQGLTERQKLLTQFSVGALAGVLLLLTGFSTEIIVPFFKEQTFTLGVLFIPFVALVVAGTSNAVNLTDGLDGLAIGPIMTVAITYGVISYVTGHSKIAEYLFIPHVENLGEISVILAAVVAAGLGFLWYNTFPAQVFMGDTGALALGGLLGFVAVLAKQELLLIICGGVFVIEAVSVIIQRYFYKITKKRVFKMAPIHHHFELMGWAEPKIIVRFWILSILLAVLALSTLKIR
jgi:phospho-N-acetylmuramoyl-pentapeptide-transferase